MSQNMSPGITRLYWLLAVTASAPAECARVLWKFSHHPALRDESWCLVTTKAGEKMGTNYALSDTVDLRGLRVPDLNQCRRTLLPGQGIESRV